jgi:hypothetical protein
MRPSSRVLLFVLTISSLALTACATPATAPDPKIKSGLLRDLDPVPCDSTIVTDGTCRGGWIIPWSLQGR